jgi:phage-related baseplate assembly protein
VRRTKKSSGLAKVLTATAAVAVISSGAVTAYATQGFEWIEIDNDGQRISISQLMTNEAYRQRIIEAFNSANVSIVAGMYGDDASHEISLQANADDIFALLPDIIDPYSL